MKRIEANDPVAMCQWVKFVARGGDNKSAFEYLTKAGAGLGDVEAHYFLSIMYMDGEGVEQDMKQAVFLSEEAAIGGNLDARYN